MVCEVTVALLDSVRAVGTPEGSSWRADACLPLLTSADVIAASGIGAVFTIRSAACIVAELAASMNSR